MAAPAAGAQEGKGPRDDDMQEIAKEAATAMFSELQGCAHRVAEGSDADVAELRGIERRLRVALAQPANFSRKQKKRMRLLHTTALMRLDASGGLASKKRKRQADECSATVDTPRQCGAPAGSAPMQPQTSAAPPSSSSTAREQGVQRAEPPGQRQPEVSVQLRLVSFGHRHGPPVGCCGGVAPVVCDIRSVPNVPDAVRRDSCGLQPSLAQLLFRGSNERHGERARRAYGKVQRTALRAVQQAQAQAQAQEQEQTQEAQTGSGSADSGSKGAPPATVVCVAVGCNSGRHRSVAFVQRLADEKWPAGVRIHKLHRDVLDVSRTK